MTLAAVALGSNLGDRLEHLNRAAIALGTLGDVVAGSSLYETAPVGGPGQGAYLNAVVLLETELAGPDTLKGLLAIEAEAGRERVERWGPRTLDLDLIFFGSETINEPGVKVPHPRWHERRFVIQPLSDVWPEPTAPDGREITSGPVDDQDLAAVGHWERDGWQVGPRDRGGLWVLGQMALFVLIGVALIVFERDPSPLGVVVGLTLAVSGAALAAWAVSTLGEHLTPYPEPLETGELIVSGPFALARHPIYGGIAVGSVGLGIALGSYPAAGVGVALGSYLWMKAGFEEKRLAARYRSYGDYRARVKRRLIPFVL